MTRNDDYYGLMPGGGPALEPPKEPTPQQMKIIADGARSSALLPAIEAEVDALVRGVQTRALGALKVGSLTPERALEAWQEIATAQRLLKSFQTRVTMGRSVAEELGPSLDPGPRT